MDPIENGLATAQEIVGFARQQGIDLTPFLDGNIFQKNERWVYFWHKQPEGDASGANEGGAIGFNMQGKIEVLPERFKESADIFHERGGFWNEAGSLQSIETAFALLKAWLIDRKQADDLPTRKTRRSGI